LATFHRLIDPQTSIFTAQHVPCTLQSEQRQVNITEFQNKENPSNNPQFLQIPPCLVLSSFSLFSDSEPKKRKKRQALNSDICQPASLLKVTHTSTLICESFFLQIYWI